METGSKERLHRLIDALPSGELLAAERYLEFLSGHGHPFVRALVRAPETEARLNEEDRDALDAGDVVSDRALRDELGIRHGRWYGPVRLSKT
ncbi:MAG: hypothetical protein OXI64_12125 [Defluviicoccus sp.]|nr:hypothetical protein [Defluviicoccus sp.]